MGFRTPCTLSVLPPHLKHRRLHTQWTVNDLATGHPYQVGTVRPFSLGCVDVMLEIPDQKEDICEKVFIFLVVPC